MILESGSTGKYQNLVSGVPLGFAPLGNSLNLMLVFSYTPLLLSRYRLITVLLNAVQCSAVHAVLLATKRNYRRHRSQAN